MISCLVVNYNCLEYTKKLINQILTEQSCKELELVVVDQASTESHTKEYLDSIRYIDHVEIIENTCNTPLCQLWNSFVEHAKYDYCAFLNNDILIPPNFLSDVEHIFQKESTVSCVIHPTNHPSWTKATLDIVNYVILTDKTRQGWDFSFRKSDWVAIPDCLDFYCGDDFIFENVYQNDKHVAMALSSPIIHWLSQTRKSPLNKIIPNRNPPKDIENYKNLGYSHYLNILDEYSKVNPEITRIIY